MSAISGPVSTLPGTRSRTPEGAMCDHHNRLAVTRVQGETDSFGAEYLDLCQECVDAVAKYDAESRNGRCDWCGDTETSVRPHRDFEEGTSGRVYNVCRKCIKRENDLVAAEAEATRLVTLTGTRFDAFDRESMDEYLMQFSED